MHWLHFAIFEAGLNHRLENLGDREGDGLGRFSADLGDVMMVGIVMHSSEKPEVHFPRDSTNKIP